MRRYFCVLAAVAAVGVLLRDAAPAVAASSSAATHSVAIEGLRFEPSDLTVKQGDSVVWTNRDPFPHTVTAQAGRFDSHEIAPGKSWKYTAREAGVFKYTCTLHPTMVAQLRVE